MEEVSAAHSIKLFYKENTSLQATVINQMVIWLSISKMNSYLYTHTYTHMHAHTRSILYTSVTSKNSLSKHNKTFVTLQWWHTHTHSWVSCDPTVGQLEGVKQMMSPGECGCIVERTERGMLPGDTWHQRAVGGEGNVSLAVSQCDHDIITPPELLHETSCRETSRLLETSDKSE